MKPMLSSLATLGLGMAALVLSSAPLDPTGFPPQKSNMNTESVLGWKIVDGRYAEGPYEGFWAVSPPREDKVTHTEAEWRELLTDEQYRILRTQGTEAPFCGVFHDNKKDGVYKVAGTGQPVFKSDAKFDSGTGWPSFFQPYDKDAIWLRADTSHGMVRMEVLASRCDSHLGHVFTDGPRDRGGLRFCINSEALTFEEKKD